MSDGSMDGALRAAFEPGESVLARLQRSTGVRSRILLHDAPDEESPLLRVGSAGGPGAQDDSRYRIVGEIAKGGVGVVYKARDRDLGRDVALKVLRKEHASNPEVLERLIEEAQIGGQLQHPGIVPVYGIGLQADNRPYFAMKLIKGRTLAAVLKERKEPLRDLPRFLRVFEQVCQTIAYAHTRGVIHRDLKPSNVMVGGFGEVLVVDWGFGKVLGRDDPMKEKPERTVVATVRSRGDGSESVAGSVMGTPAYMPPEQALGHVETLDERCDVFALGAILCEILTGKPAYVGAPEDLLVMAAQARLEDVHARLASCKADPALVDLCRRALSPLRADRPGDASALASALDEFLGAAERRAREAEVRAVHERARLERERQEALWARRSKRRTRALAATAIAAVVLAGAAWSWLDGRRRDHAAEMRPQAERALEEASRLYGAAKLSEAAAEARRASDIAAQSDLLATMRDDAQALALRAGAAAERVARRDRLVAALEECRMRRVDSLGNVAADEAYQAALADAGLDVGRDPAELAGRAREEYPDAIDEILSGLDDWARFRRRTPELSGRDWKRLDAFARALDPDPWHNALRDAAATKDIARLRAMADEARASQRPLRGLCGLGTQLADAGERDAAKALMLNLRDLYPGEFWVQICAAHALMGSAALEEALECATAAVALRPASVGAWSYVGYIRREMGDLEGAGIAHRTAVRLRPDLAEAHCNLGATLYEKGDFDGAIAAQREAIRLKPDTAYAHACLGLALMGKGDGDGAITALGEAIRLQPGTARFRSNLGFVLLQKLDVEGAMAAYREAIRIAPEDALCHQCYAEGLLAKGELDAAIGEYRESLRLNPNEAAAHSGLAGVLRLKGDIEGAIAEYRTAVRLRPNVAETHCALGVALYEKKDFDGAILECRQAIALKPDRPNVHCNLGLALQKKGDLDGAMLAHREAIRLSPGYANAHYSLGNALREKGDLDGAIAAFEEAVRLAPEFAEAHCNLGNALRRRGRFQESLEERRRGHELGSRRADWRYPSAEWIRDSERMVDLEGRLPAVLAGTAQPSDAAECLAFVEVCLIKGARGDAIRLYEQAFEKDVALKARDGYNAACAAALAAAADEAAAPRLRGLSLAWIRASLAARESEIESTPGEVLSRLTHWKEDPDLASVRDRIDELPEAERADWRKLWADVDAALAQAKAAPR
jgi:serine/threonine-protein kinase